MHVAAFGAIGSCNALYDNKLVVFLGFLAFEMCCGVFFPGYGVIKSGEIPEHVRSSVMNIFRIPVNLVVVLVLMQKDLEPKKVFGFCTFAHFLGLVCYFYYFNSSGSGMKEYKILDTADPDNV